MRWENSNRWFIDKDLEGSDSGTFKISYLDKIKFIKSQSG
jgi:hypothetical protein